MKPPRSAPTADVTGTIRTSADIASISAQAGRQAGPGPTAGRQVFRRKIDCGNSTETSAERLILRDPDHLLRSSRRPHR